MCALPLNGTRRWFTLEHPEASERGEIEAYIHATGAQLRRLAGLLFAHGVSTVLMPVFGTELAERGTAYRSMAQEGLRLLTDTTFYDFYTKMDVRVRFYGNYEAYYASMPNLLAAFDKTEVATAQHSTHRLFYGVCAESATQAITQHAARLGRGLTNPDAIQVFYGEPVTPVDLFIGFDAPTAFDIPLLDDGAVALYFTVAPTPYLDSSTLRHILYDWIYVRGEEEKDTYENLTADAWDTLRDFYTANRREVIGVGVRRNGIWYPQAVVKAKA